MTATPETSESLPSGTAAPSRQRVPVDPLAAVELCPYLLAANGAWRSAHPSRDHRCTAVRPAAVLAPEKQRALCLGATHLTCPTFQAARAPGDATLIADPLWPITRTTPIVLDGTGSRFAALPPIPARAGGQILLGALMVLAFLAVVLARGPGAAVTTPSTAPSSAVASSAASLPAPTAPPTIVPSASAIVSPSASAVASAPASGGPVASVSASDAAPAASAGATAPSPSIAAAPSASVAGAREYVVQSGDTLSSIAQELGITVDAIVAANGITDPSLIRVGQRLTIP
jgi:LysM repeat protein